MEIGRWLEGVVVSRGWCFKDIDFYGKISIVEGFI